METLIKKLRDKIERLIKLNSNNSEEIHYLTLSLAQLELIRKNKIYAKADEIGSLILDGMFKFRTKDEIVNAEVSKIFHELNSLFDDLMGVHNG